MSDELNMLLSRQCDTFRARIRELEQERDEAHDRGVREGIERVRAEGLAPPSGLACDLALAAYEAERKEQQR